MTRVATLIFAITLVCACGTPGTDPTPGNGTNGSDAGGETVNNTSNGSTNNDTTGGTNGTPNNTNDDCATIQENYKQAVRGLPRTCERDSDCRVVEGAGQCECEIGVSTDADTTDFDAAQAALDGSGCFHPFRCVMDETCQYRRLSEDGEVISLCEEGTCEVVEVMACDEFLDNAHGGIVAGTSCQESADCTVRSDLNPCGCSEAVTASFPALQVQVIEEMIEINSARCALQCMTCDNVTQATCGDDGSGNMVCMGGDG